VRTPFFRKTLIEVLTCNVQMMEDAVHFLSKETVVQAIARSATKVCTSVNEIAGYTMPIFHFVLDQPTCLCFSNEIKFNQ